MNPFSRLQELARRASDDPDAALRTVVRPDGALLVADTAHHDPEQSPSACGDCSDSCTGVLLDLPGGSTGVLGLARTTAHDVAGLTRPLLDACTR